MRYRLRSGRVFVLAYHSLDEWADALYYALITLGVNKDYAASVHDDYANATPVE